MPDRLLVDARWIDEDNIWIATSADVPGLVVEGATWTDIVREVRLVLPDLLDLDDRTSSTTVVFRAEERLDLVA